MAVVCIISVRVPICAFPKAQLTFSYCLTQWNCSKNFFKVGVHHSLFLHLLLSIQFIKT